LSGKSHLQMPRFTFYGSFKVYSTTFYWTLSRESNFSFFFSKLFFRKTFVKRISFTPCVSYPTIFQENSGNKMKNLKTCLLTFVKMLTEGIGNKMIDYSMLLGVIKYNKE